MRFVAIPQEIADDARRTMNDRFGHKLQVRTEGPQSAPCRLCLRIDEAPNDFILLSYQPLADTGPYAEIGPIFIHAHECVRYADEETFPRDFRDRPLVLRAYDHDGRIHHAVVVGAGRAEEHARALLADTNVAEVHVRHVSYTCFDFKIIS